MVRGKNRIPYWIDWRLTGLAEPDYGATISFGLPIEPEDSQYGKYRLTGQGKCQFMKGLTLTQKEQARLQVLNGILEGQISVDEAAEVLGVSERHVWRILAEYRKEGAAALAHGNRGRRANNSIPEEARTQVVALARTRYARVNHTHLTELLAEREEIVLGRSTVRRILVGAGMASPRRRRPPLHRVRRQRMSQEGMLVQVDGSVHAWLEERGPRCTLLLAIDDATSTVPYALFRHEEDTHGYFLLMQELIRRCGVPLALYSDRHAVFKYVPGSHQSPAPTQFGRAMAELGVEQIFARSPEAKGRVERANGTFQDRLVTELRLAGARTISEANQVLWAFLTRFNKRFGVPPAQSTNAYRSPDPDLNLAGILCFKHSRKVARDNTVRQAVGISRGSIYYRPRSVGEAGLGLMRRIDELHLEYPFAGSRMMRGLLRQEGLSCGRRHIATLMRRMGIEALYRKPNTSRRRPGHTVYPYLLRGLEVSRPNQVWAMDITYIPMARGFVYLAAVMDWHSRKVLAWRVSVTMDTDFCVQLAYPPTASFERTVHLRWSARGGPGAIGRQASSVTTSIKTKSSLPRKRHRGEPRCRHGHQRDRWSRARKTGSDDRDRPGTRRREIDHGSRE